MPSSSKAEEPINYSGKIANHSFKDHTKSNIMKSDGGSNPWAIPQSPLFPPVSTYCLPSVHCIWAFDFQREQPVHVLLYSLEQLNWYCYFQTLTLGDYGRFISSLKKRQTGGVSLWISLMSHQIVFNRSNYFWLPSMYPKF